MTATEQLKHQLDALPPDLREAEAARILGDLKQRMQQRQEQTDEPAAGDDHSHPLPGVKRVPYERIKHLAGIGKGPGDLLSNPKYMDDFGKSSMR